MSALHLHVGLPKCGSTSLQAYLAANRAALLKWGVDYPDLAPGRAGNMTPYAISARPPEARRWFSQSHPRHDLTTAEASLRDAISAPKAPIVLLSSEALVVPEHRVDIGWIRDFFSEVHVHIFFRRRAPLMVSAYEQLIRASRETREISAVIEDHAHSTTLQFGAQIRHWQHFAADGTVHVHVIGEGRPAIDRLLFAAMGKSDITLPVALSRLNEARSAFVHCVLAHVTRRGTILTLPQRKQLIARLNAIDPMPERRLLTPEIAAHIDRTLAADTETFLSLQSVMRRDDIETDVATLPPATTFAEIEALPAFAEGLRMAPTG